MQTRLDPSGIESVERILDGMPLNTQRGIERAFWAIGRDLKSEVDRQVLRTPKTGKFYKIRGRNRRHRASAEGESHANISGTLRKSVGFRVGGGEMVWGYGGGRVRAPIYAAAIELGRRDGSIKPRPTLRHSIESQLRNSIEHMGSYVVEQIDES